MFMFLNQNLIANSRASDFENFNPTTRADYFSVHSSRMLEVGQFNLGLFLDFALNSFPKIKNDAEVCCDKRDGYSDHLIANHFVFSLGLHENFDIGFSIPVILVQSNDDSEKVDFNAKGLQSIHINSKVRVFGDDYTGVALVFNVGKNFVKDNPFVGDDAGLTYIFEAAYSRAVTDGVDLAFNLGYKRTDKGDSLYSADFPVEPISDQLLWAFAMGISVSESTKYIAEVYGGFALGDYKSDLDREDNHAEILLGFEYNRSGSPFIFHAGVGTELTHAIGTPDLRVFFGVNWQGSLWYRHKEAPEVQTVEDGELYTPKNHSVTDPAMTQPKNVVKPKIDRIVAKSINFKPGSYSAISPASLQEIQKIAEQLKRRDFNHVIVEGHTDSSGNSQNNLILSEKRAQTVKGLLVKHGLPADRIEAKGYGDTIPIAENKTEAGRAKNRRVEFKLFY